MGKLKDEAAKKTEGTEDVQRFPLKDDEIGVLRFMNITLEYHVYKQRLMSSFIYYIATNRLGYADGTNLQFKYDFNSADNNVEITVLPPDPVSPPAPSSPTPDAAQ